MATRILLLAGVAATLLSGCSLDEILADDGPPPTVVYVHEPARPVYFDPYYNQPKVYVQSRPYYPPPERYYETKSKKTKGNKVYKTTTVKNQYGQTVYKNTTSSKKKKKK